MTALFTSLVIVFLAEMADKTQLLTMAFASRFRWQTVLWAISCAIAVNMLLAASVGTYLSFIIPLLYVKIGASVAFILFGLWTLRDEDAHADEERRFNFSPFWTVAIAFFLAEMGDKTQLATLALAADYNTFLPVWFGSTIGMILADGVGILAGIFLHKRIPEKKIKWIAAAIFIAYGIWGLYDAFSGTFK